MHSSLLLVMVAAALGTGLAILASAWLTAKVIAKSLEPMVSLSAGVLLGAALLHLLPEAMDKGMDHHDVFGLVLAGLLFFFVLEKFAIFRHSHHHEHDGHDHHHGFDRQEARRGGLLIVIGDSLHNFADGLLIASAFLVDFQLGLVTTLSVVLHEIPQQTGDYLVLRNAGIDRAKALRLMVIAGLAAVIGAALGYTLFTQVQTLLPYALVLAASSFLYVAVADLIPQMQQRIKIKESVIQLLCIGGGVALVATLAEILHHHH
ncbi:MAG TPA: ZIP family metal transporter [Limnobacter sp.]|nr:ZIP family metal transporter [Limnobacter sp.]